MNTTFSGCLYKAKRCDSQNLMSHEGLAASVHPPQQLDRQSVATKQLFWNLHSCGWKRCSFERTVLKGFGLSTVESECLD